MRSILLFLGVGLGLVSTALCAPGTAMRQARAKSSLNARSLALHKTRQQNSEVVAESTEHLHASATSSNWAGAVLVGHGFSMVTGTFVVPTVKAPANAVAGTTYSSSAWVGIDGDTCQNAILQTGIDLSIKDGVVQYQAWYEWFPHFAQNFENFEINPGDTLQVNVTASDAANGVALIYNQNTGVIVWVPFAAQSTTLCQTNAEWIVEDYSSGSNLVAISNFGTVHFTNAATNLGGLQDAYTLAMVQHGNSVANCTTDFSSTLSCSYNGP